MLIPSKKSLEVNLLKEIIRSQSP
uniref:Uncharacterized protein n=1 Tax=Rhizophora mucronata TaxID=61149 RepID=A0A2P2J1V9_RHIMU